MKAMLPMLNNKQLNDRMRNIFGCLIQSADLYRY